MCVHVQVILLVAFACVRSTWYNSIYAYGFYEGVTLGYSVTIVLWSRWVTPSQLSFTCYWLSLGFKKRHHLWTGS